MCTATWPGRACRQHISGYIIRRLNSVHGVNRTLGQSSRWQRSCPLDEKGHTLRVSILL